jgi:ATP-dependent RNA helicase DeaD
VLLATARERRKAERLLMSVHVPPVWTPAPSGKAITKVARDRLVSELLAAEADVNDDNDDDGSDELARRLEGSVSAQALVRKLLRRELARLPAGETLQPVATPAPYAASGRAAGPRASRGGPGIMFRVNLGAKDRADPRWLLPLICRRGGVTRREVGAIRIGPQETMFEIAEGAARDFEEAASEQDPRARHVIIRRAEEGGGSPVAAPRAHAHAHAPGPAAVPHVNRGGGHAPPKRKHPYGPSHAPHKPRHDHKHQAKHRGA